MVIDYSNEKTFSDLLFRDYGENRVEEINFNPMANKQMLKSDGRSILLSGYTFPDWRVQKDQVQGHLVKELVEQLKHEQMIYTPSGKLTFDHPQGQHNDIAIAWELSIHGCQKFRINLQAKKAIATRGHDTLKRQSTYPKMDTKKHFPYLKTPGVSLQSVDTYMSS